jgi:HmuY protein
MSVALHMRICFFGLFLVAACQGSSNGTLDMSSDAMGQSCQHTVTCIDQSVQQLPLFQSVNSGAVTNTSAAGVFTSSVDATAGGFTPTESYVYVKFTDQGLARVDLGDQAALSSSDWDLAFRRFIIRLNSGVSGPSCVTAARTATGTTFDTLTQVPENVAFRTEQYFTASCDYVPDGSGLMSPGVALQSFWQYPGCVKMTGNVFVIKLASGRSVKFVVLSYYTPSVQEICDQTDMVPTTMPSGAGSYQVKWAFLP